MNVSEDKEKNILLWKELEKYSGHFECYLWLYK